MYLARNGKSIQSQKAIITMNSTDNNTYQAAFFIVPSYILDLPGLTLAFLKVYETIFQFWNHRKPCFLSLKAICERTHLSNSQVCEALNFFEKNGELIRRKKGRKRYLVQPERSIQEDCPELNHESATADTSVQSVRSSGLNQSAGADTNKKNINKEDFKPPISPKKVSCKKEIPSLTQEEIDSNNPHEIPDILISEWKSYRDKPLTRRVWDKTNTVMSQLKASGIKPLKSFEHMLEKQWQGMEYRYFLDEIKSKSRNISNQDMNYSLGQRSEFGF